MSAGEKSWKIRRGSNGPELLKLANFRAPQKGQFKIDELSVFYTDADCLRNKFDIFSVKISEKNLHIIIVTGAFISFGIKYLKFFFFGGEWVGPWNGRG